MVRLVFRPYAQVQRSICTSEPCRTSTRVSSGFVLPMHSSPSFGSQHVCSSVGLLASRKSSRWCTFRIPSVTFIPHKGLTPEYSHTCWTPWSVFQDGSFSAILSSTWAWVRLTGFPGRDTSIENQILDTKLHQVHQSQDDHTASTSVGSMVQVKT